MCSSGMLVFRMPLSQIRTPLLADCCTSSPFLRIACHNSGAEGGGMSEGGVEAEVGTVEEGGEFGEAEGEALGGSGAEGDVAQFAAGAGGLAVEMEVGVGDGEDFGGVGEVAAALQIARLRRRPLLEQA